MNKSFYIHIKELVTCKGVGPICGEAMKDLGIIEDGCIIVEGDQIVAVGRTEALMSQYDSEGDSLMDCRDKAVVPGFVDSHTHFVFGGYRPEEYAKRLSGATYMEIMNSGGGIHGTVDATRSASEEALMALGLERLNGMMAMGVTTVEGKSGYGLNLETEMKQLRVMKTLNEGHPLTVVPTFMGLHACPKAYENRQADYVTYMIKDVMAAVVKEDLAVFADVFCEEGIFSIEESRRYLEAAIALGLEVKIHGDEVVHTGGAELAAELGAISADHLLAISKKGIQGLARHKVVATLLPGTAFSLKEPYAKAREMMDSGCAVALATDFNPGSCPTYSIPLVIALAAREMSMTIEEIIMALTLNGASALGLQDQIGSIEVGKQADFLILKYPSIQYLPYFIGLNIVEKVIKAGKVIVNTN